MSDPLEIQKAKEQDALKELQESKAIDLAINKLKSSRGKPLVEIRDTAHQLVAEKSIYSYALKSAKTLFSLMQNISTLKRNATDSSKIDAVLENQKILASLIIQLKLNNRQLHEMRGNER